MNDMNVAFLLSDPNTCTSVVAPAPSTASGRSLSLSLVRGSVFALGLLLSSLANLACQGQNTQVDPYHARMQDGKNSMTHEQAKAMIAPFYDTLTKPSSKNVRALVEGATLPEWRSYASAGESKGREEFISLAMGLGKLIPDLTWVIKDVLVDGDKIVVRSEARGTPAGDFMGMAPSGKSFSIMAIDIHVVKSGKLAEAYHIEDWATAMRQLKAGP